MNKVGVTVRFVIVVSLFIWVGTLHATDEDSVARATEIWNDLATEQFASVLEKSTDQVKQGLSGGKIEQMWAGLRFQLGEFESIEKASSTSKGGFDSVSLTCRFSRGNLVIRLVLDADSKLAGLWVDKLEQVEREKVEKPDTVQEQKTEVVCGEFRLPGTLSLPMKKGPFPAVVLVHGSGSHDQDETVGPNRPFRDLAWGLAKRGIAVLRYEKRTHRYGTNKDAMSPTIDWEVVDDALAAVALARSRDEIEPKQVFVVGHSLGAMAAPRIASRDGELAGVILIAGSPRSVLDLIDEQVRYIAAVDGVVTDEEKTEIAKIQASTQNVREGDFEDGESVLGAPSRYWLGLHGLDPAKTLASLDLPALIVHGGRDYQVPRSDAEIWKAKLTEMPNAEVRVFESLNHLMIAGKGPSTPAEYQEEGHVDEVLIDTLAQWILNRDY
jgi:dienelactone hydrolase